MKTKMKKGSFTIEAACVMSLILLTLIGLLYLCFFVHNRAWLTAAAYEAALAGSMEGARKDGKIKETADMRAQELGNIGFFGAENLAVRTEEEKKVEVTYTADTLSGFGGFQWKLKAGGSAKIICPTEWIRQVKAAAETIEDIGG